jgi:diguanylate cyclase (GGDEF)-like protein
VIAGEQNRCRASVGDKGRSTDFNKLSDIVRGAVIQSESHSTKNGRTELAQQIQAGMRRVGRRQLLLWSSAVIGTLLLATGMASFTFPGLLARVGESYSFQLSQVLRGLVGLALLFNIYTIYQQSQIHRMQRELTNQISALDKIEGRAGKASELAALDPLTGLYNRRFGERRLAEEVTRSQRHRSPLTVVLFDLNKLKDINDKFGHPAGDEVIKYFAGRVSRAIRGSDVAIRTGGNEFLLLLPACKPEEVQLVLGRMGGMQTELDGQTIPFTFSVGWTNYSPGELLEELMKRADAALYVNKRSEREGEELAARIN